MSTSRQRPPPLGSPGDDADNDVSSSHQQPVSTPTRLTTSNPKATLPLSQQQQSGATSTAAKRQHRNEETAQVCGEPRGLITGDLGSQHSIGHDMDSSGEQKRDLVDDGKGETGDPDGDDNRSGKRTRVEGRGSSAAQRAAASEACKGITLEALQAQYYRPLSDVAKDLRVSVARLLKKCREFGILRWPYRHVRSVQESIEQLEKDREAATDDMATKEMALRLSLLRRRGELVVHFASCGLEADMRKGIFLADPRDVDAMLAGAHAQQGGRQIPTPGWDSLGRFPEAAVREHFLEQMRAHMVGRSTVLSPPNSPHETARVQDDSTSSLDDPRDGLHHRHHQNQQQQQPYRGTVAHPQQEAQWRQEHQQQQQQMQWQQGNHVYDRGGGGAEQIHPAYLNPYWPAGPGQAGVPDASLAGGAGGSLGGGVGRGPSIGGDFGRMRSPGGRIDYPTAVPTSLGFASSPTVPWPIGQQASAVTINAVTGPGSAYHHESAGGHPTPSINPSSSTAVTSPSLRPIFAGPPGSSYHSVRPPSSSGAGMRGGGDRREGPTANVAWGSGAGGVGMSGEPVEDHGTGHRDMWRPPEKMTPPPAHLAAGPHRPWGSGGDLADPSGRSGMPPSSGAGGFLPSIFERPGGQGVRHPARFLPGTGAPPSTEGGLPMGVDATGTEAGGAPVAWTGAFQGTPASGYGPRWGGGGAAAQQQQMQGGLGRPVQGLSRWQHDGAMPGNGESMGVGGSVDTDPGGMNSRGETPWTGAGARAGGMPGGSDRQYGVGMQGAGYRGGPAGSEAIEEGKLTHGLPPSFRGGGEAWTQQDGGQQQREERGESTRGGSQPTSQSAYF